MLWEKKGGGIKREIWVCAFFSLSLGSNAAWLRSRQWNGGKSFYPFFPLFPCISGNSAKKGPFLLFCESDSGLNRPRRKNKKEKKTVLPFLKARKFAELLERQTAASKKLSSSLLQTIRGSNGATTTVWKRRRKKRPLDFLLGAGKTNCRTFEVLDQVLAPFADGAQASYLLFSWLDLHVEKIVESAFGSIAIIGESQTGTEATSVVALLCAQLGEKRKKEEEKEKALLLPPLEKSCRGNLKEGATGHNRCLLPLPRLLHCWSYCFRVQKGTWDKNIILAQNWKDKNLAGVFQENSEQAVLFFGLLGKSVYGNANYIGLFCRRRSL